MSNIQYLDEYYNKAVKDEFISEYGSTTQKTISRIFKVSRKSENDTNKDLYDFNREQLRRLLFLFMPKTIGSSNLNLTWISKYIDWSIQNSYLDGTNPLDGVSKEWSAQFVVTSNKKFWTLNELEKALRKLKLENAQDEVIPRLLFESVRGTNNSEILNLQKDDIKILSNELRLYDSVEKKERTIKVSDKLIQICEAALREDKYVKSNGNYSKDLKASPEASLVDNYYVIKSSMTRTDHLQEADTHIVHRRLSNMAEELGEEGFSSPMNLYYSGLLYKLYIKFCEDQNVSEETYSKIFKDAGEDSTQVQTRIRNEFLNIETLKTVYADELS